jgi:hypothetical protein
MMILTRRVIEENSHKYEWMKHFDILMDEIDHNIDSKPDIALESCKSIFEAVAKNVLKEIDVTYSSSSTKKNKSVSELLNGLSVKLNLEIQSFEGDYVKRLISLIHHISELRNSRAEISHGSEFPKEKSSVDFVRSVVAVSDGFSYYLLSSFLKVDLSYKEQTKYEDNMDFNDWLDSEYELPDFLSYSKALFEQDFDAYEQRLQDYKDSLGLEE